MGASKIITIIFIIAGLGICITGTVLFSKTAINETVEISSYVPTVATIYGFTGIEKNCTECHGCRGGSGPFDPEPGTPCYCDRFSWTCALLLRYDTEKHTCSFIYPIRRCGTTQSIAATIASTMYTIGQNIDGYYLKASVNNTGVNTNVCSKFTTKFNILWLWWFVSGLFLCITILFIVGIFRCRNKL